MSNLIDFLVENDVSEITAEVQVSQRFPEKFMIKALSKQKHNEFMKISKEKDKKSYTINEMKFQNLVILECCVYPDFSDADFLSRLGVPTPTDALGKVLLPGEEAELGAQILKLSGFDSTISEDVEAAKN